MEFRRLVSSLVPFIDKLSDPAQGKDADHLLSRACVIKVWLYIAAHEMKNCDEGLAKFV
jgi:hypothetical protein